MRTQLWILALAQILDMLFADPLADEPSGPSRKRLTDSLERVAGRRKGLSLLTSSLAANIASIAIANIIKRKAPPRWEAFRTMPEWAAALRLLLPSPPGTAPHHRIGHMGLLSARRAWEKRWWEVVEALSLDMPVLNGAAVTRALDWPSLSRNLSRHYRAWTRLILYRCPGVRLLEEVARLDGTIPYLEPRWYLQRAPIVLQDALILFPAPLTAAVLVGGSFIQGKDMNQFWGGLTGDGEDKDASQLRRTWAKLSEALGFPLDRKQRTKPPGLPTTLGAVSVARFLQAAALLADGGRDVLRVRRWLGLGGQRGP